jgi:hypothetical protein
MALTTVGADSVSAKTFTLSEEAARFAAGVGQAATLAEAALQTILDGDLLEGSKDDTEVRGRVSILLRHVALQLETALDGFKPGHDEFDRLTVDAGVPMLP